MTAKKRVLTTVEILKEAQDHWNWLKSVLDKQREIEGKLYIDAFIHGYKHGVKGK